MSRFRIGDKVLIKNNTREGIIFGYYQSASCNSNSCGKVFDGRFAYPYWIRMQDGSESCFNDAELVLIYTNKNDEEVFNVGAKVKIIPWEGEVYGFTWHHNVMDRHIDQMGEILFIVDHTTEANMLPSTWYYDYARVLFEKFQVSVPLCQLTHWDQNRYTNFVEEVERCIILD